MGTCATSWFAGRWSGLSGSLGENLWCEPKELRSSVQAIERHSRREGGNTYICSSFGPESSENAIVVKDVKKSIPRTKSEVGCHLLVGWELLQRIHSTCCWGARRERASGGQWRCSCHHGSWPDHSSHIGEKRRWLQLCFHGHDCYVVCAFVHFSSDLFGTSLHFLPCLTRFHAPFSKVSLKFL